MSNEYRSAQTGLPGFADKSLDEQVALFSKLVMADSKKPIYRVWSKLDQAAHSVILSELGCFDVNERVRRDEWARKTAAELKRHTRRLRRFLEQQVEFEDQLIRHYRFLHPGLNFKLPRGRVTLKSAVESEITELNQIVAAMNRQRKPRSKWDAIGMFRAQEYVKRRTASLETGRVRLTPAAIADIYQLTQRTSDGGDDPDTVENIRKAIGYFKKSPENAYLVQNIDLYLGDRKKPISKP
jgi:hypothetical protein